MARRSSVTYSKTQCASSSNSCIETFLLQSAAHGLPLLPGGGLCSPEGDAAPRRGTSPARRGTLLPGGGLCSPEGDSPARRGTLLRGGGRCSPEGDAAPRRGTLLPIGDPSGDRELIYLTQTCVSTRIMFSPSTYLMSLSE